MHRRLPALALGQFVTGLIQIGLGVAILVIVAEQLYNAVYYVGAYSTTTISTCMLQTNSYDRICQYAYSVGAFNVTISVVSIVLACFSLGNGGGIVWANLILVIWVLIGAIVVTVYANEASTANYPQGGYRNSVIGLLWSSFAFALVMFSAAVMMWSKAHKAASKDVDAEQPKPTVPNPYAPDPTVPNPYAPNPTVPYPNASPPAPAPASGGPVTTSPGWP